jgi:hypothetical protein
MNTETGFKENNSLAVFKLVALTVLHILGAATAYYALYGGPKGDKEAAFHATKLLVGIGSVGYLVLLALLNFILQNHITATLYRGTNKRSGKALWIRSGAKFPEGVYCLDLIVPPNYDAVAARIEIPVGSWIDENGQIVAEAVLRDLAAKVASKCDLLTKRD